MIRLAEIEARIGGMSDLLEIVGAMRSLAGMRMQEAQSRLPGIRRYAATLAAGIADTLSLSGPDMPVAATAAPRLGLVLLTAEHGFVGGFNERLCDAAAPLLDAATMVYALGSRGAMTLHERGHPPQWTEVMATRGDAVPGMVQRLTGALYRALARDEIDRIELIHAGPDAPGRNGIRRHLLAPLDLAALRASRPSQPPLHNLDVATLRRRLVDEYVFAMLTEAAVTSIAAENAARLAAMSAAQDNVRRKLDDLHQSARVARQSEITNEVLELATAMLADE